MRSNWNLSFAIIAFALCSSSASALNTYVQYLPNGTTYGCNNCHIDPGGGGMPK